MQPLAEQLRPTCLEEVVGQQHLLAPNRPLRRIIESGKIPNMIFYGPSGVGKTTVARMIANSTSMSLHKLNGTTASTADLRDAFRYAWHFAVSGRDPVSEQETAAKSIGIHRKRGHYTYCIDHRKPLFCGL